ncbi:MAG TPA: NAD(+)/NADH kinase [Candidatus Nitrosocosmicus sp.]|nr:NAD(+)/NADH kinase [Candidatus Nitrosocosmicus sp.]
MSKRPRCIAIFTKRNNEDSRKVSYLLREKLAEQGISVIDYTREYDSHSPGLGIDVDVDVDLAIAIGGDGTTIKTFRTLPPGIPVLCINAGGTRGILSEVSKDSVDSIVDPLLDGHYFLDRRIRLVAQVGDEATVPVLNDFVIMRSDLTKTPLFYLSVNDDGYSQKMDGIIVSTPTGSTGHSLSNGGPIVQEYLDCMLITPIGSVNRLPPFVLPLMAVTISANHDLKLIMDGQILKEIQENQSIRISKYRYDAVFLRFNKNDTRQMNKLGF